MRPPVRRLALVAHVGASVGWLGAVIVAFALGVLGLAADDAAVVRSVYLILEPVGRNILVPFSVASLITGLIQSLGTHWGLTRSYWVLIKLVMNLVSTGILLLYLQTLGYLADLARSGADARSASPVVHAAAAIVLLLVALVLSVYKPRGTTAWASRPASGPAQGLRATPP
jgi:hypothetical protein